MKPVYRHDCDACIFLGNYESINSEFDLYFCPSRSSSHSIIARFHSDGPSYTSFLVPECFTWTYMKDFRQFYSSNLWYKKALLLSYERGLYVLTDKNKKYIEEITKE